jgi:hypothetical protein
MAVIFRAVAIAVVLAACGCRTTGDMGDWALQWERDSSRLRILGEDGKPIRISDTYLAIPGYILLYGEIHLHPGRHRISYACPGEWDWQDITHYTPSVEHTFEKGETYELYCVEGYPRIRESRGE